MVSVGLLFRGQVLLDVVVHALPPASVGDFHDTICKAKTIRIYIRYGELRFKGMSIRAESFCSVSGSVAVWILFTVF